MGPQWVRVGGAEWPRARKAGKRGAGGRACAPLNGIRRRHSLEIDCIVFPLCCRRCRGYSRIFLSYLSSQRCVHLLAGCRHLSFGQLQAGFLRARA